MARKITVKFMDFESLSNYNVASVKLVALNNAKNEELKPLKEEKATILQNRAEALKVEGAVLDDVLREFSTDLVDMKINEVNFRYAEPMRECMKEQNKVLKLVNPNLYYAYCVSMESLDSCFNATGSYNYINKNGDNVSIKIGANDTFQKCIKKLYEDLGAGKVNDDIAIDKLVKFHAKRIGGLKFDRKSQSNVLKKKTELSNALVRDVITYLEIRGVVSVAEDGSLVTESLL